VELQEGLSLEKAHGISDEVENRIKKRFKDLELVTVHVGLAHRKKRRIAIPVVDNKGLNSLASFHFGSTPYFAFVNVEEGQIAGFYLKENEGAKLSHRKGIQAAHLLVEEKVDVVLAGSLGEGPFHILGDTLIQIYLLPKPVEIREAIRLLNQNLLDKMVKPIEKHEENKAE
jgi:predicted Fe-Mo cluster-binding NifX family protein